MTFFIGLGAALGAGVAWALVGGSTYTAITGAIVGFIGGLLAWRFYIEPRVGRLKRFRRPPAN